MKNRHKMNAWFIKMLTSLPIFASLLQDAATAPAATQKIVIAHRGASGYLPEHTLEAVAAAHAMGADYLEQDVVLSKDSVPVVLHDVYLDTVTDVARRFPERKRDDGRFYVIDFTLDELKRLKVTERFDPKTGMPVFPGRFPPHQASFEIPTLEEEIQLVQGLNKSAGRKAGVYPEIKKPAWHKSEGKDLSPIVIEMLARYGYRTKEDMVYLQCFDFEEVKRIRGGLGYKGRLIQLISENSARESPTDYDWLKSGQGLEEVARVADGIGPAIQQIVSGKTDGVLKITDLVKRAHDLGLEVHPYTLRADALPGYATSFEELLRIFFMQVGVEGVFTDHSDRAVSFLKSVSAGASGTGR